MSILAKEYTDLDRALDEVRTVLEEWSAEQDSSPSEETIRYTQLVLHEWLANLLQHATFQSASPVVRVDISSEDQHVHCVVVDNSEGFNFEERLPSQEETMDELPERGMGLRIINACTKEVSYISTKNGRHRFEFSIPADHDPWLSMLF